MKDASDDDEDVEAPQDAEEKAKSAARQQARREREAKIREMMDKDEGSCSLPLHRTILTKPVDESMEDPEKAAGEEQEADTSMPIDAPAAKAEEEKPTVTVSGGRRRGRRKMTIKKTTRDDDGFIGTISRILTLSGADLQLQLQRKSLDGKASRKKSRLLRLRSLSLRRSLQVLKGKKGAKSL